MTNNDKNREETKMKLWEQVYGKKAPDRSISQNDMDILKNHPLSDEQLSPEWQHLKDNSEKLQAQTSEILKGLDEIDLDRLQQQIKSDFGSEVSVTDSAGVKVLINQADSAVAFEAIEAELNKVILCQKDYIHELVTSARRPFIMGLQPSGLRNAILISGQKATGRHSSVTQLATALQNQQVIQPCRIAHIDLNLYTAKENEGNFVQDLYTAINNAEIIQFDGIENCAPAYVPYLEEIVTTGKLNLNKRYVLTNGQLTETSSTLVKNTFSQLSFNDKYLVFITPLSVNKLLNVVGVRFINAMGDICVTRDIISSDIDEIYQAKTLEFATKCLDQLHINVTLDKSLSTYLTANFLDPDNAAFVVDTLQQIYEALAEFKLKTLFSGIADVTVHADKKQIYLKTADADQPLSTFRPQPVGDISMEVKKEFDDIIGLKPIKDYIMSLQDFYAAQKLREKRGLKTSEVSKHMIFTGNPGTGKTTIARLLAKYLKSIGVLSNGQLVEVSRSDLVGKYLGHTAPQTMQVIKSAMGGVLFIDEAYSLYRGQNDSFGLEAIDTLVKAMEDNREDLIVVLAGYTVEMQEFMSANSGLKSRFPIQIEFPDYTAEELYLIAGSVAKGKGYKIDTGAQEKLTAYFDFQQKKDSARSGNGRMARNIVEDAIITQSKRVLENDKDDMTLLKLEDFNLDTNHIVA